MSRRNEFQILGLSRYLGNNTKTEIFVVKRNDLFSLFRTYFHEVGHELSLKHSFLAGEVLSPAEADKVAVQLSWTELDLLITLGLSPQSLPIVALEMSEVTKRIADRILNLYAKGSWDENSIVLHNLSEEALELLIIREHAGELATVRIKREKKVLKSTKAGRNIELPAIVTEQICMGILLRSLNLIAAEPKYSETYLKSSSGRAKLLADRLIAKGAAIPSTLDMRRRK